MAMHSVCLAMMTPFDCSLVPVAVSGIADAIDVEVGERTVCAVRASGAVSCWGRNSSGEVGDGTTMNRRFPTAVSGLTDATQVSVGDTHACAIRRSGQVVCWGENRFGEIGDGTMTMRLTPVAVSGLTDAVYVAAGGNHTCAVRRTGSAVCWGRNNEGQLGDGTLRNSATPVVVLGPMMDGVQIATGHEHSCGLRSVGVAGCWGRNDFGQLGDGTRSPRRATPAPVMGLTDAAEIGAGRDFACARRTGGAGVCWGNGAAGRLGNGAVAIEPAAVAISGLTDAIDLGVGGANGCAVHASGGVSCWGANGAGQVGDGTRVDRTTPTPVSGLP
jgi:alpha-tubulin suppressor-like RCC1 family protein